jgi:outer membrane protein OmpA-like peptidoglycan-associated protein
MKTHKFFALGVIFLVGALELSGAEVKGAQLNNTPDDHNYVVIGAFSVFKNATSFTEQASKMHLDAKYEINKNRNLYYVYVLNTNDRQQAIDEALRLRKESPYNDTWVYHGSLGQLSSVKGTDINPATEQSISKIKAEDAKTSETTSGTESSTNHVETSNATASSDAPSTQPPAVIEEIKKEEPAVKEEASSKKANDIDSGTEGKTFFFKIFRSDDQHEVEGDVNVIDAERSRKMGTFAGNKEVKISDPNSKEGKISMVCEVFGFRKVQRDIDYETPEGEGVQANENNATVVPFELVRLQKGDIAVMYNVFFFKDAAVMRPESRYEVTSLLNMLKENPKYKIKIHGHTNGGAHGKIISLKSDATNFFALNDTKDGVGSAKKLSQERADVIRNFLLSNGVEPNRMEVKAWGGKRPIYDKHSPQAQSNVRVEIEILEN